MDFSRRALVGAAAAALVRRRKAAAQESPAVRKTVYAWYPARFGTWETSAIQWDALTHLCFRSVVIGADGSVGRQSSARLRR